MDQPEHEGQESDGAEQAFVALREEVAALRRGVELVYRQGQEAPAAAAPDYSPTLGAIAKELKAVTARLDAIYLAMTSPARPRSMAASSKLGAPNRTRASREKPMPRPGCLRR